MKNIHVIATDKPSRLTIRNKNNELMYSYKEFINQQSGGITLNTNQNIYITSDEEIKEGDWYFLESVTTKNMVLKSSEVKISTNCKKIILTTDPTLIADGVQAIDDEFLEWFVKNPSCREVELTTYHVKGDISGKLHYKIIIPKEEPKITNCGNKNCQSGVINGKNPKLCKKCNPTEEPKDVVLGYKTSLDAQMLDKIEPKQKT